MRKLFNTWVMVGVALLVVAALAVNFLTPRSVKLGAFSVRLLDGEVSAELSASQLSDLVSESRIASALIDKANAADMCTAISQDEVLRLLACGPIFPAQPADVTTTELVDFADQLMRDAASGGAVTIASSDQTLAEHRATLLTDGVTVLDFVSFRPLGAEAEVPGLFIERASQAEWLGYATGSDGMYLIWATAPTRQELEAVIKR
jgi:hypothetical protein